MPDLPELPRLTIETWAAVGAIAVGLLLCFRGFAAMRWILALIGGFAGWQLGSWAATFIQIDPDFDTALRWGAVVFSVILFGSVAYAFFVTGVLVAVGWLGWTIGALIMERFDWAAWLELAIPLVVAAGLVVLSLITKLPKLVLVLLTGVAGAGAVTIGALALVGSISLFGLDLSTAPGLLSHGLWWNLALLVLAGAGVFVQLRTGKQRNLRAIYG
ncbi:MAG: hypothetical protein QM804_10850 [Propionicimonas sp.]